MEREVGLPGSAGPRGNGMSWEVNAGGVFGEGESHAVSADSQAEASGG